MTAFLYRHREGKTMLKRKKQEGPEVIRIWKAPKDAPCKYVTVTEEGELVYTFPSLSAIRKRYRHAIKIGDAVLKRELDKTYRAKGGNNST